MIVICKNDFPIGVLPGATNEQADSKVHELRTEEERAATDPHQMRSYYHWHDVPELKA